MGLRIRQGRERRESKYSYTWILFVPLSSYHYHPWMTRMLFTYTVPVNDCRLIPVGKISTEVSTVS